MTTNDREPLDRLRIELGEHPTHSRGMASTARRSHIGPPALICLLALQLASSAHMFWAGVFVTIGLQLWWRLLR
jgi:hypothetical protein